MAGNSSHEYAEAAEAGKGAGSGEGDGQMTTPLVEEKIGLVRSSCCNAAMWSLIYLVGGNKYALMCPNCKRIAQHIEVTGPDMFTQMEEREQ